MLQAASVYTFASLQRPMQTNAIVSCHQAPTCVDLTLFAESLEQEEAKTKTKSQNSEARQLSEVQNAIRE